MRKLLKTLLDSRNLSDTSTILKMYEIKFRGDYVRLIDYLISIIISQNNEIEELKNKEDKAIITLRIKANK